MKKSDLEKLGAAIVKVIRDEKNDHPSYFDIACAVEGNPFPSLSLQQSIADTFCDTRNWVAENVYPEAHLVSEAYYRDHVIPERAVENHRDASRCLAGGNGRRAAGIRILGRHDTDDLIYVEYLKRNLSQGVGKVKATHERAKTAREMGLLTEAAAKAILPDGPNEQAEALNDGDDSAEKTEEES